MEGTGLAPDSVFASDFVLVVGCLVFACCMGSGVLGYFWIVRPFDRLVDEYGAPLDRGIPVISVLMRLSGYCLSILRYWGHRRYHEMFYDGFDFRSHASRRQVVLSAVYLASVFALIVGSVALGVYQDFLHE